MIKAILLSFLGFASIYTGLIVLNSIYVTFLVFHVGVCVVIPAVDLLFIRKMSPGKALEEIGFRDTARNLPVGLFLGLLFGGTILGFFYVLGPAAMDPGTVNAVLDQWKLEPSFLPYLFLILIFGNSVLEEVYWRGYIFSLFRAKTTETWTVVFTALFYASYHFITTYNFFPVPFPYIFTGVIFLMGLYWGLLRLRTNSIWVPLLSHLLADLGIMGVYYLFVVR